MTNELEKTFFYMFGIEPKYVMTDEEVRYKNTLMVKTIVTY